jgi:two-component system osmolarity sensor histidine kinase EnvZ
VNALRRLTQGLVGQAALVLLLAVFLESLGSTILHGRADIAASGGDQVRLLAEQMVALDAIVARTPASIRAEKVAALSTPSIQARWTPIATVAAEAPSDLLEHFEAKMERWKPELAGRELRLSASGAGLPFSPHNLTLALQTGDGGWVTLSTRLAPSPWVTAIGSLGSAIILLGGLSLASLLILRSIGAPLRALTQAADRVGSGERVTVAEVGAGDLRRVAKAFNAMQARIANLTEARTQALAAVSHDLRTPLARMRLRAGEIEDGPARAAMESDIDEMSAMLGSVLSYLKGDEPETPRRIDLAAMAMTVVDDAVDLGRTATYKGPNHLVLSARPVSLKRALTNLVDNAVIHGGSARVSLVVDGAQAVLVVEDRGPGISDDELLHVLQPFHRLDAARARNTPGLGLGLSIVAEIVRREGGVLTLSNRPRGGGLRAEIRLGLSG